MKERDIEELLRLKQEIALAIEIQATGLQALMREQEEVERQAWELIADLERRAALGEIK